MALAPQFHSLRGDGPIAFLKGSAEIYVTDAKAENPRRFDHNPRGKSELRWDGHGSRISYFVGGEQGEHSKKTIIVELDKAGNVVMEAPVPDDVNMRFVEDFKWLPNGKARLGGSMNPRNCILEDLDPATGGDNELAGRQVRLVCSIAR